jgi:hypothetical protein
MRKIPFLLLTVLFLFSCHSRMKGQAKPEVHLQSVTQMGEEVRFTLRADQPFIVGDNFYTLCIGATVLDKSDQKGKSRTIDFLLTRSEFDALQESGAIYLTYGPVDPTEDDLAQLAAETKLCWSLGTFTHALLK